MARVHVRCRKCEKRRVLKWQPDHYKSLPKCNGCGTQSYRPDAYMNKRDTKSNACFCGGYHFKHRMSSLYCFHRKDGSERYPGDVDFWDRNMSQEEHDALVAQNREVVYG